MITPAMKHNVRSRSPQGKQWLLDRGDAAWKIVSGSVDVFLVDTEEGEIASRLFYVGTWRDGETVCGMGTIAMEKGSTMLLARGSLNVALKTMDLSSLSEEQIEGWIAKISHISVTERPPSTSLPAEAGSFHEAGEDTLTLIGTRGVVWVSGDTVALAGGMPQMATAWVPLSRSLWATVAANRRAACISTHEWLLQRDANNADLASLHRVLLYWLIRKRSDAAAASSSRLERKLHQESFLIHEAMERLATPLGGDAAAEHSPYATHTDGVVECCRIVARSMGMEISVVGVEEQGCSAEQRVRRLAEANGIRYRKVLLRDGWWNEDNGAMIGFSIDSASAIALLRKGRRYVAVNAITGVQSVVYESFAEGMTMHAYVFYRSLPEGRQSPWQMFHFGLRTTRRDLRQLVLVSLLLGLLGLILPLATAVIFEEIIPEGEARRLASLSVLLFAASVASFLIHMGQSYLTLSFEGRLEMELQAAVWDRLLRLPLSFFRKYQAVSLGSKSLAIGQVRQVLAGTALTSCLAVLFSLMNIALLFYYSVRMALFVSSVTIALAACFVVLSYTMVQRRRTVMQMETAILSRVIQLLQGVAKLRSSGNEARGFARWARIYGERTEAMMLLTRTMLSLKVLMHVFPSLSLLATFLAAGQILRVDGTFTTGQLLAFYAALGQFLAGVQRLSTTVVNLAVAVPVYERLQPVLDEPLESRSGVKHAGRLEGRIEFSHVSFRYGSRGPMVLQDISFTIMPGEFIAVVGESGSGKSTLLRLLLGFETPHGGAIAYDGRDLAGLNQQQVRRQIGTVLQRDSLMPSDLVSNILGGSGLSIDHAWEAARSVGLENEIRAMPMGMHTVINDTASGLSGGQKQRLLIARAIVRRPRILFFDEATSALDNQTQAIVSRSLNAMQATRLVIAHRLSTIVQADRILVLREGRLHADGSYDELLKKDVYFRMLAAGQMK